MPTSIAAIIAVVCGYLLGSIPVAGLVAGRRGIDLRRVGDRNPGYWNAKEVLGRRAAVPVFVGDVLKGAAASGIAVAVGGPWWVGYLGGGAAMIGHAWPAFARFRGGRSILTFAGAIVVLSPVAAAIAIALCVIVSLIARRFAWGARLAVFGFPVIQALFEARARVAATGVLMSIIGLRFALAARQERGPGSDTEATRPL